MPTINIRFSNLPACCRDCLEKCPECVLRAELWRQARWQLSHGVLQNSPQYPVPYKKERFLMGSCNDKID